MNSFYEHHRDSILFRELTDLTRLHQILEPHSGSRECSVNRLLNAVEHNNANDRDNDRAMQAKKNVFIMFLPFSRVTFFSVRRSTATR
jgi:hypothetical protein